MYIRFILRSVHALYLNRFRRKPAISELDWPFTPSVKSSQFLATNTGSALVKARPAHR